MCNTSFNILCQVKVKKSTDSTAKGISMMTQFTEKVHRMLLFLTKVRNIWLQLYAYCAQKHKGTF